MNHLCLSLFELFTFLGWTEQKNVHFCLQKCILRSFMRSRIFYSVTVSFLLTYLLALRSRVRRDEVGLCVCLFFLPDGKLIPSIGFAYNAIQLSKFNTVAPKSPFGISSPKPIKLMRATGRDRVYQPLEGVKHQ